MSCARLFAFASVLALTGAAAPLAAETEAPTVTEGVTVTATRSEKPVDQAPATVSVITSDAIADNLVRDIKDLVQFEPGVAVPRAPARFTAAGASTGRDGDSGFNIRGLEGNRVLITVDGVRMPDGYSFGAQAMGRGDYVDLDLLKSVEIVRGPTSALYGSDGLAGSVSFITNDPSDLLRPGQDFTAGAKESYAAADKSFAESALVAGRSGAWEGLLAYTRRDGHEQETHGDNDSGNLDRTTANPEDTTSNAILAKLLYRPAANQRLRLTFDHLDSNDHWNVLTAVAKPPLASTSVLGLTAHDRENRDRITLDHRYQADLPWLTSAQTSVYYQNSTTRQISAEDRYTAADRTRDSTFDNRIWGGALELKSQAQTGIVTHRLVYGGDISVTRQEGVRGGTVPSVGDSFPSRPFPITDFTQGGAYVQDEISLGGLSLYPAVRMDYFSLSPKRDALYPAVPAGQSASHVSPKLSAVWRINETVGLFANLAEGFKAPSPSQVNNNFANVVSNYESAPNPGLKPETSVTYEGGIRLHGPGWSASATGFTGDYSNFIDQVQVSGTFSPTDPAVFQFVNLEAVHISGAEAKAQAAIGMGFTLQGGFSYAQGTTRSAGVTTPLNSIEPIKVVAGLGWREAAGRFGGQLTAVHSEGKAQRDVSLSCSPACFTNPAFTVLDLTAFWSLTPSIVARAGIFNLTDQAYFWWSDVRGLAATSTVIPGYSQPGRNASLSVSYRF